MKKFFTLLFVLAFVLMAGNSFSQSDYSGIVRYNDVPETPVKAVTVKLFDSFGNLYATTVTNGSGKYTFKDLPSGSYTIKMSGYLQGATVDMNDVFVLWQRLMGFRSFTPLQELIADANGDGKVNWKDMDAILIDYFLYGRSNSIGKKVISIPRKVEISGYALKEGGSDIIGLEGDLEGAFEPSTKTIPVKTSIQYTNRINVLPNSYVEVPVYFKDMNGVAGFFVSLNFPEQAMDLEQVSSQIENLKYNQLGKNIRLSWQNTLMDAKIDFTQPVFVLKFRTSDNDALKGLENITLNNESQVIDINGNELKDAKLALASFGGFENTNTLNDIYPNPVQNTATIHYSLSAAYKVSLSVYNTVGQLVTMLVNEEQNAGAYEIVFNRSNLHLSAGSYIYRLECKGDQPFVQSKLMIVR